MVAQRTLRNSIQGTGIGLHSGEKVAVTLHPAPEDTGIVFRRADLPECPEIPAWVENVVETTLCTTLGVNGIRVATVEHLMAAFAGLGIDNAYVDLDGAEVPIMDGSAAPFVFLLQCAGVREQEAAKRFIRIKRRIQVSDEDRKVSFEPCNALRIHFQIDFDHPLMRDNNEVELDFSETAFTREISRARTFGFARDVERLQEQGVALGGNLDNAIVVDDHRLLNEEGLRYHDEFVRHKVLDSIGDLYLMGHPVLGCFRGYKSGHALNNRLLRALLADSTAWEMVEREECSLEPRPYLDPLPSH
ncbi:UDP-3-O-(3-hydroxymyristoyl) glucosamine N-acyltransferase [Thiohalorhabdus denitrificans]|uniref:UDP-3-O-acyl-N-acetylglucosamine deacetylase n=1 Tax=Thiohalorhabdus denitrificans TaxID=381306 RepID=A0A0P9CKK9_9GAMM|nr:UDP-3-O-acyl-N-acetylglucosamine deacetylase [Thiohalorhabdus denitrificans]KPV39494.1 UDP-3-O-(3-hydroxymyristoyl) glucosamine N-acyltransferase [Thiohalorhabdus denitrificans]SCY00795.1 UDP-3-O-[3-hydroxymyristoyl] N-acetylglucosamine deacetylase [Thiohalorhabdus denitrificans]